MKWSAICGVIAFGSTLAAAAMHKDLVGALNDPPPGVRYTVVEPTDQVNRAERNPTKAGEYQVIRGYSRHRTTNPKSAAAALGAHQRQHGGTGYQNVTSTNAFGTQYGTYIVIDGQPMLVIVDTGSSDTWVVAGNHTCVDSIGVKVPQSRCAFGPPYNGGFKYGPTEPAEHMTIQYGDGEVVSGPFGYSDVKVGNNITVKKAQISLADKTFWFGDNVTSGLLGLAYPSLTNAYLGSTEDGLDDPFGSISYAPFFTTMVNQGKVPPVFSMTIDRNASSGMLSWGGTPPATGLHHRGCAEVDMVIVSSSHQRVRLWCTS